MLLYSLKIEGREFPASEQISKVSETQKDVLADGAAPGLCSVVIVFML